MNNLLIAAATGGLTAWSSSTKRKEKGISAALIALFGLWGNCCCGSASAKTPTSTKPEPDRDPTEHIGTPY